MPSKGNQHRGIRMDDDFWAEVKTQAAHEGINVSELVRGLLRGWLSARQDDEGEK